MLTGQRGFSLLEMILTLALSSILIIGLTALLPNLTRQYYDAYRQYRLAQSIAQALFKIEKDLRRAGFIKDGVIKNALIFNRQPDSSRACLIIRYDLNHNGKIDAHDPGQSELFGYRLLAGALEQSRGAVDCSSGSWEKIVDDAEINVTHFDVEMVRERRHKAYFIIRLGGYWRQNSALKEHFVSLVAAENL